MIGVQRKSWADLLDSIHDGRLAKQVSQMRPLTIAVLMIEGEEVFSENWTREQYRSFLYSIRASHVWIERTDSMADTVHAVRVLAKWAAKDRHTALMSRPKPKGRWGTADDVEYACHLLQSFPGIGPVQAKAIVDHFGRVPLQWTCDADELRAVKGIGKVRAQAMVEVLGAAKALATENQANGRPPAPSRKKATR